MRSLAAAAMAAVVIALSSPAAAQNYRSEIMQHVIRPCVEYSVQKNGLDETIGLDTAVDLIITINEQSYESAIGAMMTMVQGQPLNVRLALYEFGLSQCISGAS